MSKKTTSNVKSKGNVGTKIVHASGGKGGGQGGAKYAGNTPKSLSEIRTKFDGLRDVANKMPDGAVKNTLVNQIEDLYLSAASWFKGLVPQATA